MVTTGRVQWIDGCKGFAILLVILGHTMRTDLSLVYIYGFHMPLFFFLSGLVCNEKKYTWGAFLKSRFNSLVIPYIAFYLFTWLYWLFVERSFRPLGMEWWQPLIGMVYGAQWHQYMDHNGILWFLPCLFITEVLFYAIKKIPKYWLQITMIIALTTIGLLLKINLPWCVNIACVALQFFYLGNILRGSQLKTEVSTHEKAITMIVSITAFVAYILISAYSLNYVNMASNKYGSIYVFELLALLGSCSFVYSCKSLNFNAKWGGQIGRNTLVVFALHQPILRVVRFVGDKLLHSFPVETSIWYALAADFVVLLCLIPLIWLYNKYGLPILKKLYI